MPTTSPFINEFHYDNAGADVGEFIEIAAAAGTDLTGYSILLYNGSGGAVYATIALSGIVPNLQNGRGVLNFARPADGIQNGAPDGIALVGPGGVVLEFISYEGVMTAVGGAANGMVSTNVGVSENGTANGTSIARIGSGENPADFTWALSNDDTPGGVNGGQTFTSPNALATISVADANVTEGDTGTQILTFTVTRSSGTGAATVAYATADGSAFAGSDYVATSGTLTFAEGQTSLTVSVTVNGDMAVEGDETLTLTLSNPTNATLADGVATGTIVNDDVAASTVNVTGASVAEGDAGTTALTFTVTRSNGTGTASVAYATTDGTATAGTDYVATNGTITFAEGETSRTVTVLVNGDIDFEPTEAFSLTLSNASGTTIGTGSADGTITNDDVAPPVVQPFLNEFHYDNSGTDVGEFIEIAGAAGTNLTGYQIVFYNGNGGTSYGTRTLSGTIPNQQNGSGVVSISASGLQNGSPDAIALVAPDGTVLEFISYEGSFTATNGPAAGLMSIDVGVEEPGDAAGTSIARVGTGGTPGNFTWALSTDDTPGQVNIGQTFTPTVSVSDARVVEGNAGTSILRFAVTRSSGEGIASVDYASADGVVAGGQGANGADYQSLSGTIQFAAGETRRIIEIVVNGDLRAELDERVLLNLTNASPGLTIADAQGVGTIINDDAVPATVSIGDVRVTEGDAGETLATFTVSRTGGTTGFSVDFATADGTASAGSDYVAATGTLVFAEGETSKTITIVVNGDGVAEPLETFAVNLGDTTNDAVVLDGQGVGTIVNDDLTRIYQLQGEGHVSPFLGEIVLTEGVVTAIDTNGFYMQDVTGDGNVRTSDAIFVFTGTAPLGIAVGDIVRVQGEVEEFQAGGAGSTNLSTTQISGDASLLDYDVVGQGTIQSTAIGTGAGERAPPTRTIDDDGLTTYDPETDGIDFYESLEGMLVTVKGARAVASTDSGGTYVVASDGAGATGINDRGGITIAEDDADADLEDDFNPERILIYDDSTISGAYTPNHSTGDRLGDVTGVVSYFGGEFEVIVTAPVDVVSDITLGAETTTLVQGDTDETSTADQLTVASYNVENLDPSDGARIDALAEDIVNNLGTPDVISLVEVQDADGAGQGANLSGQPSAQALIDAIFAQSGVRYEYVEIAPTVANTNGGEPGGNIRNGFLYNPLRADYVDGSAVSITGDAYAGSRKPLSAQFSFNGETVTLVSVHSTSRGGSDPLFGNNQPPQNAGDAARLAQTQGIKNYIDALQAADPDADVIVLGDFNAFYFEDSVELLEQGATGLTNLYDLLAPEERYSYVFGGNAQTLDHILVSQSLRDGAQFDAVHINSGVPVAEQASDHDALLTQLLVVGSGNNRVIGTTGADVLKGFGGDDRYTVNNAGDQVIETANQGIDTVLSSLTYTLGDNVENLTLTGTAADGTGNALNNVILGNASANILTGLAGDDTLNGGEGDDTLRGGDGADTLDGGLGVDLMEGGDGDDTYVVDNAGDRVREASSGWWLFNNSRRGGTDTVVASISYALSSELENLTLTGTADLNGTGNFEDNILTGNAGANVLDGSLGDDKLFGNAGSDRLLGGFGDDLLDGGTGTDILDGGWGGDTYVVDDASDRVIENGLFGTDTVRASVSYVLGDRIENLVLTGSVAIDGTGNRDDNALTGNEAANTLNGGDGDDTLNGGAGNDSLIGGNGRDHLDGGTGDDRLDGGSGDDFYVVDSNGDVVIESSNRGGTDTVQASVSHVLGLNLENLTLTGTDGLSGTGNGGSNRLLGNAGDNALNGLDGDDFLFGGAGGDTVTGGSGRDTFVFTQVSDFGTGATLDRITDFDARQRDRIDLSDLDADTGRRGEQAFRFIGDQAFSGRAGELRVQSGADGQHVYGDVNGDGIADFDFLVTASSALKASDFLL